MFIRNSKYRNNKKESKREYINLIEGFEDNKAELAYLIPKEKVNELSVKDIILLSFRLGCSAFGTAKTRIELFRGLLQKRKNIIDQTTFNNLLDLCLLLPGYSSSIFLCGIMTLNKKSVLYGILSLISYNLPSLFAVIFLSYLLYSFRYYLSPDLVKIHSKPKYFDYDDNFSFFAFLALGAGIAQAAISLLIESTIDLMDKLSKNKFQYILVLLSFFISFIRNDFYFMILTIFCFGFISIVFGEQNYLFDLVNQTEYDVFQNIKFTGIPCIVIYFVMLILLLILKWIYKHNIFLLVSLIWFQAAGISIGEGNVLIPIIYIEFTKLIPENEILNGYALTRLLPGSLLNCAAFIGVSAKGILLGILSGIIIFIPGLLFMYAAFPYFQKVKNSQNFQLFISGSNSAGIGFIMASIGKLWYSACMDNPYTTSLVGSINILICYLIGISMDVPKIYVIGIGALLNISMIFILNYLNLI